MLSKFSLLDLCLKKRMHGSPQIIDRFLHGQTISREQLLLAVAWGLFMPASEKVKNVKFLEKKLRWGSSSKCNHMEILRVRTMFTFACRTILTNLTTLPPNPHVRNTLPGPLRVYLIDISLFNRKNCHSGIQKIYIHCISICMYDVCDKIIPVLKKYNQF